MLWQHLSVRAVGVEHGYRVTFFSYFFFFSYYNFFFTLSFLPQSYFYTCLMGKKRHNWEFEDMKNKSFKYPITSFRNVVVVIEFLFVCLFLFVLNNHWNTEILSSQKIVPKVWYRKYEKVKNVIQKKIYLLDFSYVFSFI